MAFTIYGAGIATDGWITHSNTGNWSTSRDAITATADHNDQRQLSAIRARKVASGRGTQWRVSRAFFTFGTVRYTQQPVSGTLHIKGHGSDTANISVVKSTHSSTLTGTDFNNIDGWTTGSNLSNVTYYNTRSGVALSWNAADWNVIDLNQQALSDIATSSLLKLCLINNAYDLRDVEPSTGVDVYSGCYFQDNAGTSSDPYITIHPDTSTFFGTNF